MAAPVHPAFASISLEDEPTFEAAWAFVRPVFQICFSWESGALLSLATLRTIAVALLDARSAELGRGASSQDYATRVARACYAEIDQTTRLSSAGVPSAPPPMHLDILARWEQLQPWCAAWGELFGHVRCMRCPNPTGHTACRSYRSYVRR